MEDIKNSGGILYFIEHKKTRLWLGLPLEYRDDYCSCPKCSHPFIPMFKDNWTDDPQKAMSFLTKIDAEKAINCFIADELHENLLATEHEFLNPS